MEMADSSLDASARTEDLKYIQALSVNVSNFVSVKLSGRSNYKIWKAQMLCLIEIQLLLHLIDAEHPFPVDKGVHMISQYDKLIKGWIFGSVKEKVLEDLVDLGTAREVWMKLESLFNPPISDTEEGDTSNAVDAIAPVVSPIREDLKYIQASTVNVSSFVSVKLSGYGNYHIWKAQMICLVQSQDLLHILGDENRFSGRKGVHMIWYYDKLVKGWIFSSMNEKVLKNFAHFNSAQDVWRQLEFFYNPPTSFTVGDSSNATGHQKLQKALYLNVSNYVSVNLSGHSNYHIWKAQMLGLLQSQNLVQIIREDYPLPGASTSNYFTGLYQEIVIKWILKSMNDDLHKYFEEYNAVHYLWKKLESIFNPLVVNREGDAIEDMKYMQASNVNVSCFVSVTLSGHTNYHIWKAQIICLIESQMLLHLIDPKIPFPEDKGVHMIWYYDKLVKGWIFGSMNEKVLEDLVHMNSARDVWWKLESCFSSSISNAGTDIPQFIFGLKLASDVQEIDRIRVKRLYKAAVEGCWWKAKSILKKHKNAATEAITEDGNTILHLAVETGQNYFVEKLLEFLKDGKDTETQNDKGRTALHIAAIVGNEYAAQLLVQKREELLLIEDDNDDTPPVIAFLNTKLNSTYLLKSVLFSTLDHGINRHRTSTLRGAIIAKEYDFARTLLENFDEVGLDDGSILMEIAITFPTDLGFTESFIYPSFNNLRKKTVLRISLLFQPNFLDKCVDDVLQVVKICNNKCYNWLGKISMILLVPIATLYPIYQLICLLILVLRLPFAMLYFLIWKVLAVTVHSIKNIEKTKKQYREAKMLLNMICNQMAPSSLGYTEPILRAVRQGTYEVVDEILFRSPLTVNCKDEDGYNVIQLAIINRSEKVYNLIHHIIERTESYRATIDSSQNNLAHLAGTLAPSFVLNRSTGAALQLQRELIWCEDVEKLMSPTELIKKNIYKETPAMVFTREHQDLMKQGESWMKTTAESCSITAALIVTVVFAASITVPGGSNQESGIPLFRKEIAFTIFAVSNAFSLFTAATALLLFLSILTARFSERDFRISLPRRLIFGLFTLFLSTTAMIVAFGAILFLVFCDQRPWMLAPICVCACLPISVIVTIKVPLLVDLIKSTFFPIFGKKSYLESCKIKRNNTHFTD